MKIILTVIATLLLSACAGNNGSKDKFNGIAKKDDMVCEYVAETGSHRKKKKCMSVALAEEVRKENQQAMRQAQQKGRTSTTNQ